MRIELLIFIKGELGLFAKIDFKKGDFLGTYHGENCKIKQLQDAFRSKSKFELFCKKYNIKSKLGRKETCEQIEKLGKNSILNVTTRTQLLNCVFLAYALDNATVLVMPRYPICDHLNFYLRYNAMMFVNEPPDQEVFWNSHLEKIQMCEVNVVSYNNYEFGTIDYVAETDIPKDTELLVFYGNKYHRKDYQVNESGCNVGNNKTFF